MFPIFFILFIQLHVTVTGQITATIIADASEVCLGDSVAAYLNISGGDGPWEVVINDNDGEYISLVIISSPHTLWLSPDATNTYKIASVEDSNGTPGSPLGEAAIVVHQATPVTIEMDRTVFLQSESDIVLASAPSGGSFSGAGVAGNKFYPGIATAVGSPHLIHCELTNEFECISTDDIDLHVLSEIASVYLISGNDTINAVCDDGATYNIRGNNEDNIPGTFELVEVGSTIPIPSAITDTDPLDDEAVLDPAGLSGAYDIIYTYGMEQAFVKSTLRFHANDLGSLEISNFPDTVCLNDNPFLLVPELFSSDPGATYSFSGLGVSGNQDDGYYYDPASPDVSEGDNEITLDYTSSNGCKAKAIHVVYNSFIPVVSFVLSEVCLPVDGGTVSFANITVGKFSVASWSWDFGHPESGSENFSTLENPDHFYPDPGDREISLSAITHEGCIASYTIDTLLADQPVADLTWLNDCFLRGEHTSVINRSISTLSDIDTLIWTFKTDDGSVLDSIGSGDPTDTINFLFNSQDKYLIQLHVENEVGCFGDVTKEIFMKPTVKLAAAGYNESFNENAGDWLVASRDNLESWVLDVPEFSNFEQVPGNLAWYTSLPAHTEGFLEQSWVESPCFDFTEITQPIVQLDLMKSFIPGTDGAVLQYQDLVIDGWKTVGNVGEGSNWFNEWGIFNEPGGSSFGWGLALFEPDFIWVKAGHALDMLVGNPHVKFRIAIATGGKQEIEPGRFNQGFAFDNFFIGERHRCSILEYFTNSASESTIASDSVVDAYSMENSEKVVDLQYHMDYPGVDDMNANNPYPASTRSFYYGVPAVPHAVLNGGVHPESRYDFSDSSHEPGLQALTDASLEIPVFDVSLNVDYLETNLEATIKVTCSADTFDSNIQLHVVVIEREVTAYTGLNQDTTFRNVVLDMLPTPAGKLLGSQWNEGKSETETYSWDYAEYVEDLEDLAVVAFVQDRDNGNVLQADVKPHTPGVGIRHRQGESGVLVVYPNPAMDHLYVNFGGDTREDGQLKIVDLSGKVVMKSMVQSGYGIQHLSVSHLSQGMYMIFWMESGEIMGRNKLVISR